MNKKRLIYTFISMFFLLLILSDLTLAYPFEDEEYTLEQPDGTLVDVLVSGDEFYRRVESIDGYTLTWDEEGWICYAELNDDGTEFISSGVRYWGDELSGNGADGDGMEKHIDLNPNRILEIIEANKQKIDPNYNNDEYQAADIESSQTLSQSVLDRIPLHKVPENVTGVIVLVDFDDDPNPNTGIRTIHNIFNYPHYINDNNTIRSYFLDISGGELDLRHNVIGYYRAQHDKDWYHKNDDPDALVREVGAYLQENEFALSSVTTNSKDEILSLGILYYGNPTLDDKDSIWSVGLWPHRGSVPSFEIVPGFKIDRYMMTNMSYGDLYIGRICHELGHLVCYYPDLYDRSPSGKTIEDSNDSFGLAGYSLMARDNKKEPQPPDAYCRNIISGWGNVELLNEMEKNKNIDVLSKSYGCQSVYLWENENNPEEYFLIENIQQDYRYQSIPDEGLIIWHVDENGNNDYQERTKSKHYQVSVEQADGLYTLESPKTRDRSYEDISYEDDLFHEGNKTKFNSSTEPNSKWWNGIPSGLNIYDISSCGETMSFKLGNTEANIKLETEHDLSIIQDDKTNQIKTVFKVINNDEKNIDLADIEIRYYYTRDDNIEQIFECYYACKWNPDYMELTNTIIGSFIPIDNTNADCYLKIRFDNNAGGLEPGKHAIVNTVITKDGWKDYDLGNDYSFSGQDEFEECTKVTVYYQGSLVWGSAPN